MDIYLSMCDKLRRTGVYSPQSDGLLGAELSAYGVGLQTVENELEQLSGECFVQTARSRGLSVYENMMLVCRASDSIADRRKSIMSARQIPAFVLTKDVMEQILGIFSLSGTVSDSEGEITVTLDQTPDQGRLTSIRQQLSAMMPPGIVINIE